MTVNRHDYNLQDIQEDSNLLLKNTLSKFKNSIPYLHWRVRDEEDQKDKGINFECELEDKRSGETYIIFKIRNKGTDKNMKLLKTTKNRGLISFQLKVRNAKYYRNEINLPLIFILCDLKNANVYWHPIQLDENIDIEIENAENKKKKSIQIYIHPKKILNVKNLKDFLKDVSKSNRVTRHFCANFEFYRTTIIY